MKPRSPWHLAIPNDLAPLQVVSLEDIAARADLPLPEVAEALKSMAARNMLFTAPTEDGSTGYALLQIAPDIFLERNTGWYGQTNGQTGTEILYGSNHPAGLRRRAHQIL
jgi:hypothetical protein